MPASTLAATSAALLTARSVRSALAAERSLHGDFMQMSQTEAFSLIVPLYLSLSAFPEKNRYYSYPGNCTTFLS